MLQTTMSPFSDKGNLIGSIWPLEGEVSIISGTRGHAHAEVAVGGAGSESPIWYKLIFKHHCFLILLFNQSMHIIIKGISEIHD